MDYLKRNTDISIKIMEEMKKNPLVEGVMFLGGVARGFADVDSDIDMAIFSNEKLVGLPLGENVDENGIDIEFFNIILNNENDWDPIAKEAYYEGKIAFDRNGKVKEYLDKNLYFDDEYRNAEFSKRLFDIAWHGYIYTPYRGKDVRGYHWILPNDLWYKRGCKENGFFVMQKCAEIFMEMIYIVNRRWTPDFKWIYKKSIDLPYLPSNYKEKMDFILFAEFCDNNFSKKCQYFQEMLDEVFEYMNKDLPDDLYHYVDCYE